MTQEYELLVLQCLQDGLLFILWALVAGALLIALCLFGSESFIYQLKRLIAGLKTVLFRSK